MLSADANPQNLSDEELVALMPARSIVSAFKENDGFPAGYTYLAQLMVHDLTRVELADTPSAGLTNREAAKLDLSSIFADGPGSIPGLYDEKGRITWDDRFDGKPVETAGQNVSLDPWMHPTLRPKVETVIAPGQGPSGTEKFVMADERNADNVIILQIRNMFCLFHNMIVDRLSGSAEDNHKTARTVVETTFRSIIRFDLSQRVLNARFADYVRNLDPEFWGHAKDRLQIDDRPIREFGFAVGRVGHNIVRRTYDAFGRKPETSRLTSIVNSARPERFDTVWRARWEKLFELDPAITPLHATRFGPFSQAFFEIQSDNNRNSDGVALSAVQRQIINLDILRSSDKISSGQSIAQTLGSDWVGQAITGEDLLLDPNAPGLTPDEITKTDMFNSLMRTHNEGVWLTQTPLLLYVQIEALKLEQGQRLGPVGSFIFAATLLKGLKGADSTSEVRSMPDLLKLMYRTEFAGLSRPLHPDLPSLDPFAAAS